VRIRFGNIRYILYQNSFNVRQYAEDALIPHGTLKNVTYYQHVYL